MENTDSKIKKSRRFQGLKSALTPSLLLGGAAWFSSFLLVVLPSSSSFGWGLTAQISDFRKNQDAFSSQKKKKGKMGRKRRKKRGKNGEKKKRNFCGGGRREEGKEGGRGEKEEGEGWRWWCGHDVYSNVSVLITAQMHRIRVAENLGERLPASAPPTSPR